MRAVLQSVVICVEGKGEYICIYLVYAVYLSSSEEFWVVAMTITAGRAVTAAKKEEEEDEEEAEEGCKYWSQPSISTNNVLNTRSNAAC